MRAFVIVRVSAEDQLRGYGPEVQWEDDILPNAPGLGLTVSEKNRRMIQESATGWERPKFEAAVREAMALHESGEIDALMFPRVDRETRFVFGSMALLIEVVKAGIPVYFAREKLMLDPKDPESVERYLGKATQAQAYVQTMKANTSRAKAKLVREGKIPQGTGVGIYGYRWIREEKRREIIEIEAKVVQKIFGMIAEGKSLFAVAKELNRQGIPTKGSTAGNLKSWHPLTIRRIVQNPCYTGKTYFGTSHRVSKSKTVAVPRDQWKLLPDATPAIISQELFDKANAELAKPRLRPGRAIQDYLLKGHVFCLKCGRPLVGAWLSRKYRYYQCSGARPTASKPKQCDAGYVRADWLEEATWAKIHEVLQNPDLILEQVRREMRTAQQGGSIAALDKDIAELQRRLRSYPAQKARIMDMFQIDGLERDELLDRLNKLRQEIDRDNKALEELRQSRETLTSLAEAEVQLSAFCENATFNIDNCGPEEKKLALDMLDIRAYASPTRVDVKGFVPIGIVTIEQTSA